MDYVRDGEIVLNISMDAVQHLQMGNEEISCGGRFGGVAHQIVVPVATVNGIFAKETGQGLAFQGMESSPATENADSTANSDEPPEEPPTPGKPRLRVVK